MASAQRFEDIRRNLTLDASGGLTLYSLPMILLPSHFFVYIMEQVEAVAGPDALARIYRQAGYDGAVTFCRRRRESLNCSPLDTVAGYLAEMSVRGWGRFEILELDPARPRLRARLTNSALAEARLRGPRHEVWVGAMEGALAFLLETAGRSARLTAREVAPEPGDAAGACRIHVDAAEARP